MDMMNETRVNEVEIPEQSTEKVSIREIDIDVRVRYPECDPMNVVHHAVYPVWMEMARTELLRKRGFNYSDVEKSGIYFAVAKMNVKYLKPAFYDDELVVHAEVKPTAGVKIEHEYTIKRDGVVICKGETTVVCLDRDGKLQPIPEKLR